MTITATSFGGATANAGNVNLAPGSLTSSTGDVVVVVYGWFDGSGTAVTQAAGTVTSTPAKTFAKATEFLSAGLGLAVYSWVSDGTTLTQINVAPSGGVNVVTVGGSTTKVASTAGTVTYDSTTKGTGTDSTTPLAWSAGGAISGAQIGFIGVTIDNGASGAFTTSSGYTMIHEQPDGTVALTDHFAYKNNETGTPSLSVAYTAAVSAATELFVSFKEPAATASGSGPPPITPGGPGGPGGWLGPGGWQWTQQHGTDPSAATTNAPAEVATGTGQAFNASTTVAPSVGQAAGTGSAFNAKATVAPTAGAATGTGSAFNAGENISPTAGVASGTGTANNPGKTVAPTAGVASGTGTAFDATAQTGSATNAPAGLASGTGTAFNASPTVAPSAGNAAGTGTASNAKTTTAPTATAATGTGTAFNASVTIKPTAGNAAGTGQAFNATGAVAPTAGQATGTGTAHAAKCTIAVKAGLAAGTGTAYNATVTNTPPIPPTPGPVLRGRDPQAIHGQDPGAIRGGDPDAIYGHDPKVIRGRDPMTRQGAG